MIFQTHLETLSLNHLYINTIQLTSITVANIFWIDSTLGQDGGNQMEVAPQWVLLEVKRNIATVILYLSLGMQ